MVSSTSAVASGTSGQLTLNHSTVTHNTDWSGRRRVQHGSVDPEQFVGVNNTATDGTGGIFNCGGNPGFESFGLCTGSPSLTLNNSTVSNNVGAGV